MRIGIDAGGTFTDFVVLHDDLRVDFFKLRSDPADPARVILEGIRRAVGEVAADVDIVHGSTVATNALLERKGARTAFVASPGFRDLLAIGRQNRTALYSLRPPERANLVPQELCFEWTGDAETLRAALRSANAESVGVCLLRAYTEGIEEAAVRSALADSGIFVSLSSEIAPEFREYERASTTVLNSYVGPVMGRYLSKLESECPFPISIMQSSGGFLSAGEARTHAVRTLLSGPAGGVVAARTVARLAGSSQAIAFDMGGTSTDVSVVEDPFRFATEAWIEGLPVRVPLLDIHTVGAGGGSLASVDHGGRLRVGPESAGARPGPACYGTGERATVTDAHVVLGRILPERFLDGSMVIDKGRAEAAVARVARDLGTTTAEAAQAILRIANSNMERAIRVVTVEKGCDPRDFPLVAFGGCGGLHACEIAEELGIGTVLFPPFAGALSALGMLLAPGTRDYTAGALGSDSPSALFARLEEEALDATGVSIERYADIRYRGQSYELTVDWNSADPRAPFEAAYSQIYGFADPARPIEIVTVRVRSTRPVETGWLAKASAVTAQTLAGELIVGRLEGPSLLFDYGSTLFIPGGWAVEPRDGGVLIATRLKNLDTLAGGA